MTRHGIVSREVLAAAFLGAERRASVTGFLNLAPPAFAGFLLTLMPIGDALAYARQRLAVWTREADGDASALWGEVLSELEEVQEQDAKEGRGAA